MIDRELRRKCITATDVGPIFGVDGYRDAFDVWAEKHGQAPPFEPTPRMLLGKDLEQGIVAAYSRITGRPVSWRDETVQHAQRKWMAASPDALVVRPGGKLERGVDAKLVFYDQRRKWGLDANSIPEGIQLQMWWLMAVVECEVWDVAVWLGDDEPRIYEIERNLEAERTVIEQCEEWHRRYVIGDEIPPISGSKASRDWLVYKFPSNKRNLRDATAEEIEVLEQYAHVRLLQKEATDRRNEMESQIKLFIQDSEGVEWQGGKFTWKLTKEIRKMDWKELATYLLNTRIKTEEEREGLRNDYLHLEPGQRRIRFVSRAADLSEADAA